MISIYFGERKICLSEVDPIEPNENYIAYQNNDQLAILVNNFKTRSNPILTVTHKYPSELLNLLSGLFKNIEASGGLVVNPNGQYLMIYRLGKWDLPKGKNDPGESASEAALREVSEETGLHNISIVKELKPTYHTYLMKNEWVLKKTNWFLMSSSDASEKLIPQTSEDISQALWVDVSEIPEKLKNTYPSVVDVFGNIEKNLAF